MMRRSNLAHAALAIIGGVAWALCFGERGTVLAPWVALVPLMLLLRARRAFWSGWLYGISYWLVSIVWIVPTLETFGGLAMPLAIGSFLLLCLYLGSYYAVFAAVGAALWRRSPNSVLWSIPALWVLLEVARAWLLSGFPWNLAAYAVIEVPGALELSSWIGAYGISFLVVSANVATLLVVQRVAPRRAILTGLAIVLALALGSAFSSARQSGPARLVNIVQPNTPILTQWDEDRVWSDFRRLLALSEPVCEPGSLVVWPESAAWPFMVGRDAALTAAVASLNERGCSVVLNSASKSGARHFNSAFLFAASGERQRYDKRHLVPFGEYVPLRGIFPFLRRLARAAGDFSPGQEDRLLSWDQDALAMAICFEIVFPGEITARVRDGASILVTITNDAWYGDTAAPWQHLRAARFRAAENRRPLVRAALTGISAQISDRGRVEQALGVGEEGVLRASVSGARELSFYARFPWAVPALCGLLVAFAILRPASTPGDRAPALPRGK